MSRRSNSSEKTQKTSRTSSPARAGTSTRKSSSAKTADELSSLLKAIKSSAEQTKNPVSAFHGSGFSPPLLLVGPEELRMKRLIGWLKENIFSSQLNSVSTFFGSELTTTAHVDRLVNDLRHESLFSSSQLVILYNVDAVKAALLEGLVKGLTIIAPSTLVVMTAKELAKKQALSDIAESSTVVQFGELKGPGLSGWIQKEIQRNGVKGGIAPDAVQLLTEVFGNDTAALSQEIAKYALLVSGNEQVTRAHILPLLQKSPERNSFELFHAISAKNSLRATHLASQLVEQGLHPLQISSFLSRCVRTLMAQGESHAGRAIPSDLSNPWFARNLTSDRARYSGADLISAVNALKDLDLQLKSSNIPHPLALSLTVERMASRAAPLQMKSAAL